MLSFIAGRLLHAVPTVLAATLIAFLVISLAPGDFLTQLEHDPAVTPQTIERLRQRLALDQPVLVQYLWWLRGIAGGYLGESFQYQAPVTEVLASRVGNSLILVVAALLLQYGVAIPAGVYAAVRRGTHGERALALAVTMGLAIPSFFLALLGILFSLWINRSTGARLLPVVGMRSPGFEELSLAGQVADVLWHLLLPALVAAANDWAGTVRVVRAQLLEALSSDYVRTARAMGIGERAVVYRHALKNAILPLIANAGAVFPALITGAGFVEVVFGWPGLTPLTIEAFLVRDVYLLMGGLTIGTMLLVGGNLLADLMLSWADPRIRYQ